MRTLVEKELPSAKASALSEDASVMTAGRRTPQGAVNMQTHPADQFRMKEDLHKAKADVAAASSWHSFPSGI